MSEIFLTSKSLHSLIKLVFYFLTIIILHGHVCAKSRLNDEDGAEMLIDSYQESSSEVDSPDKGKYLVPVLPPSENLDIRSENVYMLFIGLEGSGKTSTISQLFPKSKRVKVGENVMNSAIPEITEYFIHNLTVPELGITNSQVRIIDTPGLIAFRNSRADLVLLSNLIIYLRNHEQLQFRPPNIVAIFSKFDEPITQLHGSSAFIKMLQSYNSIKETFQTIDNNNTSNILYILTHFMSETKKITKNPTSRLMKFEEIIKKNIEFLYPIKLCVGENEGSEFELPQVGNNYKLPNKQLYPQNLIDAIESISSSSGDKNVSAIFRAAFENRNDLNITFKTFKIQDEKDVTVNETLELLKALDFQPTHSNISIALNNSYKGLEYTLRKNYPGSLQLLQKNLENRNISNINQIPQSNIEIIKFFHAGENMNPAMVALIENVSSIKIPHISFDQLVGYGYDVLEDTSLDNTPFIFDKMKFSKLGFMIPEGITGILVKQEFKNLQFHNNITSYRNARLQKLNVSEEIKDNELTGELKPGFNIIQSISKSRRSPKLTCSTEYRKFLLTLNNKIPFNQEFLHLINNIPVFNLSSLESVEKWNRIFELYGTHIAISGYGGGELISTITLMKEKLERFRNGELGYITNVFRKAHALNISRNSSQAINSLKECSLNFDLTGGGYKFKLSLVRNSLGEILENIIAWEHTLIYKPVILQSSLILMPLSTIIRWVNNTVAIEMEKAMNTLLQGTLEYVPPPTSPPTLKLIPNQNQSQRGGSNDYDRSYDRTNTEFVPDFDNSLIKGPGYGYDLIQEKLLRKTPFILNQNSLSIQPTRSGYDVSFVNLTFPNIQKYINYRSQVTNARIYISTRAFKGIMLPGYGTETSNYSVVKEYRVKLLTLKRLSTLTVNNEFKEILDQLRPYNKDNCESANQWRALFNEYGTHILSSAYMGGAIQFIPYGNARKEIQSIQNISRYFEYTNLNGKQFTYRAIGGNPQILSNYEKLNSQGIDRWASSIHDHTIVLTTDIKLIPIHALIEITRPQIYYDSIKSFNDYFDGNLKACDIGVQCGPFGSIISGECACPSNQKLIEGHCKTLEGRQCSLDSWDNCVPNSLCISTTGDNYGICKCRNGFEKTSNDLCYKRYGTNCFHSIECEWNAGLDCISDICQCASSVQRYDLLEKMCLSTKDGHCGDYEKFGVSYNLKCKDGLVCKRQTQTCM